MKVTFTVNGRSVNVDVEGWESLLWVLRDHLSLFGAKPVCDQGECGACSVMLNGKLVCSCLVMVGDVEGGDVVTVEGLVAPGELHPVQAALVEHGAIQCGFCTPGVVMAGVHLVENNSRPSPGEVREALSGNLCRCTGYGAMVRALVAVTREPDSS